MDYGGYLALSGRRNWADIRADRAMEAQYLQKAQDDLQARIQQEAQSRQGVIEYMNAVNAAPILEQDLERVKGVETAARQKVIDGLKKAGNNYNKFLLGEGSAILNGYYQTVKNSDEMQNAINNKLVHAQHALDQYLGRDIRPAEITLPDGTKKEVPFEEQLQMFNNGEITKLNYGGSDKFVPFDDRFITANYGKNRYKKQAATRDDIYDKMIAQGAQPYQANKMADAYEKSIKSGATPLYFKQDEYPMSGGSGAGNTTNGAEYWINYLKGVASGNPDVYNQKKMEGTGVYPNVPRNAFGNVLEKTAPVKTADFTPLPIGKQETTVQYSDGSQQEYVDEVVTGFGYENGKPIIYTNINPNGETLTNTKLNQVLQALVAKDVFSQAELAKALKEHPEIQTPEGIVNFMGGGQGGGGTETNIEELRSKYNY